MINNFIRSLFPMEIRVPWSNKLEKVYVLYQSSWRVTTCIQMLKVLRYHTVNIPALPKLI